MSNLYKALQSLLNTTELNLDEIEPETQEAINEAHKALDGAKEDQEELLETLKLAAQFVQVAHGHKDGAVYGMLAEAIAKAEGRLL